MTWHRDKDDCWIFCPGNATYLPSPFLTGRATDERTLSHFGLQTRRADAAGRAAAVHPAFHAFARVELFGDAAGNGIGKYPARTAAADHGIHNRKRRAAGAGGNQRAASKRRFEGPGVEHIFDPNEPAGKSGSLVDALADGSRRNPEVKNNTI